MFSYYQLMPNIAQRHVCVHIIIIIIISFDKANVKIINLKPHKLAVS